MIRHEQNRTSTLENAEFLPSLDGQITDLLSSPACKNIPLRVLPKSAIYPSPSRSPEGRFAIVTNAGRDAVDADGALDELR
jgi:hypothetical protein